MTPDEREELRRIPKAELHLHLEGSLSPATLWELSQRQGHPFGLVDLAACRRVYEFHDFTGFIQAIKTASQLLAAPADYAAAVRALARQLRTQGVVYCEAFVSIGILLWRKAAVEPFWAAIEQASVEAEAETGVRLVWIFDAVRQFGVESFDRVLQWALQLQTSRIIVGIGIGGDERAGPAAWFARGYARARDAGLHTTVHAGETCGPESVWDAVQLLGAERIGHGLHAFEDERLLDILAERQIGLDICPTSNLRTGAWAHERPHPAHIYYKRGVKITIGSDDPGIFACSLLDEYVRLRGQGFSEAELRHLAITSFNCSFLSPVERRAMAALPLLPPAQPGGDGGVGVQ